MFGDDQLSMDPEQDWEKEWRGGIEKRLAALEDIRLTVSNYHLDVLRLITDERDRRRDLFESLSKRIDEAHTAVRTMKWLGGVIGGSIAIVLAVWDHFTKKP